MNECAICGKPVDVRGHYSREVTGWVEDRGKTGGTNHVRNKEWTGRVAHQSCVRYGPMQPTELALGGE